MPPTVSPGLFAAVLAIAIAAFGVGSLAGWTANGWRLGLKVESQRADVAEASLEVERQTRLDLEAKEQKIGDLDDELTKARADLAAARRRASRVDSIELCPPTGPVRADAATSPSIGPAGPGAGADAVGSPDGNPRTMGTAELYALTDEGDEAILELKLWREYARAIGAIR